MKPHIYSPETADQRYCARCIFAAAPTMLENDYLCQYILLTGKRRGCKPGRGCPKRVLVKNRKEKK